MLNSKSSMSDAAPVPGTQEFADIMRLLRLFVGQVEAGSVGAALTRESALFQAACRLLDATPEERATTRTALMVLRDLVWRVDAVCSILGPCTGEPAVAEALKLLDTSDIHQFLRQEP